MEEKEIKTEEQNKEENKKENQGGDNKDNVNQKIKYEDFAKVEIKAGKILEAEKVPDTDKLLKLKVDFSEENPRQIISGISKYFEDPKELIGKVCMFVTNLEPRKIKGLESNGMLFAVSCDSEDGEKFSLLEPNDTIPPGSRAC